MAHRSSLKDLTRRRVLAEARRQYFSFLGVSNLSTLEDLTVADLLTAIRARNAQLPPPIRLKKTAKDFLIDPRPEIVQGYHNGELRFDSRSGLFRITLCCHDPSISLRELGGDLRYRFTYAHEIAHRFFFIQKDNGWLRAIDLAADAAGPVERIRRRVYLTRLEEGACNRIAARVLIPDEFIVRYKLLDALSDQGPNFYRTLTHFARKFGVSRECLLVRLREELRETESFRKNSGCILLIGYSRGLTRTSHFKPRIRLAVNPAAIGGIRLRKLYPGMGLEGLGKYASDLIFSVLDRGTGGAGEISKTLELEESKTNNQSRSIHLKGWRRRLNGLSQHSSYQLRKDLFRSPQ